MINRVIIIVLDSLGVGALPDADEYGDCGANTLGHVAEEYELQLPNLEKLGVGKIIELDGISTDIKANGVYGKMAEKSVGKDTTTGHWELAGIVSDEAFPTYPDGFPDEIISEFEKCIEKNVLGNYPASGTTIIEKLGPKHIETENPIVYTSADSVFQIAAHEEVISVEELYEMCKIARDILTGKHGVARVIARPFVGKPGEFNRTNNRKDFSLTPPEDTILDRLDSAGMSVLGVGKIEDIFAGRGLTGSKHMIDNMETVDAMLSFMEESDPGLIFVNLVEFDMKYGHRRDVDGYGAALERFDERLQEIYNKMNDDDILFITADHGCDPTYSGTDHTREYVPILGYGDKVRANFNLGVRCSFADLADTVAELLGVEGFSTGNSFSDQILV